MIYWIQHISNHLVYKSNFLNTILNTIHLTVLSTGPFPMVHRIQLPNKCNILSSFTIKYFKCSFNGPFTTSTADLLHPTNVMVTPTVMRALPACDGARQCLSSRVRAAVRRAPGRERSARTHGIQAAGVGGRSSR